MDFERKPAVLLYADLFKTHKHNNLTPPPHLMSPSDFGSGSSSTNPSSSCDSSSSELSSPFGSELDSSESDDGDYMAELTRQMAECMLQEEEEEEAAQNSLLEDAKNYNMNQRNIDSGAINILKNGLYPTRKVADDRTPPLQVYNLKNQPPVSKQLSGRLKGAESTQQIQKTEQQFYMQYRGRDWRNKVQAGSGMQAVFLGQSGSRNGSTGTGVFLPRVTTDSTALKKKSGCSTVLIPTRVLQTLELHFNRRLDSRAPPSIGGCGSPNYPSNFEDESTQTNGKRNGESQSQNRLTKHEDEEEEMQLPKEWTY
ncbi:hypothetical protein ACJIZ3_012512 [Penstemon smallii]|uniref:Uncharacterized protein n=1 Tax=Penstemon smallii TaxID=265156 RepID=A0ABD3UQT4_9LAMI